MNTKISTPNTLVRHALASRLISLVGAGGKTTLMYSLAKLLYAGKTQVVCTTTTKIASPSARESPYLGVFSSLDKAPLPAGPFLITLAQSWLPDSMGYHDEPASKALYKSDACPYASGKGKLRGYPPEEISLLSTSEKVQYILVEADGAAKRLLKVPEAHEPVIPAASAMVIAVIGLQAVGRPLTRDWVWREKVFSQITGLEPDEPITIEAIAKSICHPQGLLKGAPAKSHKVVFLNTMGTALHSMAKAIAECVFSHPQNPVDSISIGSAQKPLEAECVCKS